MDHLSLLPVIMFPAVNPLPLELWEEIFLRTDVKTCINLRRFDLARRLLRPEDSDLGLEFVKKGDLAGLKWLHDVQPLDARCLEKRDLSSWRDAWTLAAMKGHIDVLEWMHAHGFAPYFLGMAHAAHKGRVDVLRWFRATFPDGANGQSCKDYLVAGWEIWDFPGEVPDDLLMIAS